jgi:hypothetical protein
MTKAASPQRETSTAAGPNDKKSLNVVPIRADADSDPLADFKEEPSSARPAGARSFRTASRGVVVGLVVAAAAAGALVYARQRAAASARTPPVVATGRATLDSRPSGVAVIIDGVPRGVTPIELTLSAGEHDVLLHNPAGERRLTVRVDPGTRVSENVDMPSAIGLGRLDVISEPAGARVSVDGIAAGRTPLKARDLSVGRHAIIVADGATSVTRTVDITAGATMSMFISLTTPAASTATGTLAVESPIELRLIEDGHVLGLSNGAPLVFSPGKHKLELVSDALEMRLTRTVTVESGKADRLSIPAPNGTVFINASPWADVSVDGRSIGVTPLGDVSVPVGSHEVLWRHPQLGERRRTVNVGAQTPVRLTMDMTR